MMKSKMSKFHSLAHAGMLIIIVGLLSLYLQLRGRYKDLAYSCGSQLRTAREPFESENHCTGISDGKNNHACSQNKDSSATTSKIPPKAAPLSSSEAAVNSRERHSQTGLTTTKAFSVSITESSFDSRRVPFETSWALTVDDFGKTGEDENKIEAESKVSSTDVIIPLQTSLVEITNTKIHDFLKSQDIQKQRIVAPTVEVLTVQPISTVETQMKRQYNAYSQYDDEDYPHEDETTTESVLTGNTDTGLSSSVMSFSAVSLSVSQTSRYVHSTTKTSGVEEQNFGKTDSDTDSRSDVFKDGNIFSTENISGDTVLGNQNECQSGNCEGGVNIKDSRLHIQPVPPNVISSYSTSDLGNVDVKDDDDNTSSLLKQADVDDIQTLVYKGTSAKCGTSHGGGSCHFQNLCYNVVEHDFIFLKGEQSVIERQLLFNKPDIEDLFDISLSTVPDHNAFKFSPIILPAQGLYKFSSVAILQGKSFIMRRFKPDNVMHVLHDDVLPLYHTLHSLDLIHGQEKADVMLLFADNFDIGDYANFYKSLSSVVPVSLWSLNFTADILCFADSYIGLSNSTLWYQYGFFKPQGPVEVIGSDLLLNVRGVVNYLARHFHNNCMLCTNRNYLILLSRKDNRLILNEGELMMSLARSTKLKVMSVSMETHSVEEIVSVVKNSRGIIGMHGSLLSFLIFLQPGSFVIELFPYAVNASKYTPFRTFCDFPGSGIIYRSWTNQDKDRSVPHPDWAPEMGGIHHLLHDTQKVIMEQSEVPEHLCCEDPSWLYHIYQDTEVDIEAVTSLTTVALAETSSLQVNSKSATQLVKDIPVTPGPVKDLVCKTTDEFTESDHLGVKYLLIWELPWNLDFIEYNVLDYQLVISEHGNDKSISIDLPSNVTSYSLEPTKQRPQTVYNVWVRVTVDKTLSGPYAFVICKINI